MRYILYMMIALAIGMTSGQVLAYEGASKEEHKGLGNNTGRAAFGIIRSLPSDLRERFYEEMVAKREVWHKEMKQLHQQLKSSTERFENLLRKKRFNALEAEKILDNMQEQISDKSVIVVDEMRQSLIDVIAQASARERQEMADDLEEVLDEWEDYKRRPPSPWWRFWRIF